NRHAEKSDRRDRAAADARRGAAIPATTATETARPMVPGGLDDERQLLRTGLRQGAGRYSEERLVSGRLARERQAIASAEVRTAPLRPGSAWPGRIFLGCDAPLSISAAPALPRAVRA